MALRITILAAFVLAALPSLVIPCLAQAPRKDFVWARSTAGAPITMDGKLTEPAWAVADSVVIRYGVDTGIPGSGWKPEAGILPSDPTNATIKFLAVGNQIWMGATVRDKSIGGSNLFNRFDGFRMAIKDHATTSRPAPPVEYFYSWWYPEDSLAAIQPGRGPNFRGRWTGCNDPMPDCTRPRTPTEIANWDAATVVHGFTNSDAANDTSYVVEMRFNLAPLGYDITKPAGDAVEFNISIYDCDWFWPFQNIFSSNRVWYEGADTTSTFPAHKYDLFHNVRIMRRPDVTVSSGPAPALAPDVRIWAADNYSAPTMNGLLSEPVWALAPKFYIRWGDDALRASYPGEGPWRSGQVQPAVNGGQAAVLDPGDATVRWFFKGDKLYLGFDVRDQVVQYVNNPDRYDGFIVSINDYSARDPLDNELVGYKLTFQVGPTGNALAQDDLPALIGSGGAQVALALKPGTVLDTTGISVDTGYTAEMWIDLTKIGYPPGRGDGRVFLGIDLLDGDSYTPFTDSYGTRTWWQREFSGGAGAGGGGPDGPAWGYLDPSVEVAGVDDGPAAPDEFAILGNRPNPFGSKTSLFFTLPRAGDVSLEVFDPDGRRVAARNFGREPAGPSHVILGLEGLASGLYLYRLQDCEVGGGSLTRTLAGKMILVR